MKTIGSDSFFECVISQEAKPNNFLLLIVEDIFFLYLFMSLKLYSWLLKSIKFHNFLIVFKK